MPLKITGGILDQPGTPRLDFGYAQNVRPTGESALFFTATAQDLGPFSEVALFSPTAIDVGTLIGLTVDERNPEKIYRVESYYTASQGTPPTTIYVLNTTQLSTGNENVSPGPGPVSGPYPPASVPVYFYSY